MKRMLSAMSMRTLLLLFVTISSSLSFLSSSSPRRRRPKPYRYRQSRVSLPLPSSSSFVVVVAASEQRRQQVSSTNEEEAEASSSTTTLTFEPIFDFGQNNTVEKFERIDDAIMGGISTSTVRNVPGKQQNYASWSGVCRIDGGGFCGMRTRPFDEPIHVGNNEDGGFYIDCRLTSDDEPQRRVWKMTTRSEPSRGEQLYQAQFTLPNTKTKTKKNATNTDEDDNDEWSRILIPFTDFKLVRGPRMVDDGTTPLNTTTGLFQIGLSMSKFQMSRNMTEIENFRPGYFEVQLKTIGLYSHSGDDDDLEVTKPTTLSLEESKRRRPLVVKILLPVITALFSEQSRRRRSAMKLLREGRGMSTAQAIMFGIRRRGQSYGMPRSLLSYAGLVLVDSLRTFFRLFVSYVIFFPLRVAALLPRLLDKVRKSKSGTETNKSKAR